MVTTTPLTKRSKAETRVRSKSQPQKRVKAVDVTAIEKAATLRRARERLDRIEEMRDAQKLAQAGRPQRDIADLLHTTQPRVHRMLRAMEGRVSDAATPEEIILRATVDGADRDALVKRLTECTYTFRRHAPAPIEGAVSGSWDDVKHAFVTGLLSQGEYERVRDAVKPPQS
jgi:predicted XRE-type DNA-binding protein